MKHKYPLNAQKNHTTEVPGNYMGSSYKGHDDGSGSKKVSMDQLGGTTGTPQRTNTKVKFTSADY